MGQIDSFSYLYLSVHAIQMSRQLIKGFNFSLLRLRDSLLGQVRMLVVVLEELWYLLG